MTKLEQAARALLAHWDTPAWKYLKPTGDLMADLREALEQLNCQCGDKCFPVFSGDIEYCETCGKPTALAEQAEQEPVAWRVRGYNQFKTGNPAPWRYVDGADKPAVNKPDCCDFEPLYASPVRTKDLTDEEIMNLVRDECVDMRWPSTPLFIARAVIAKDREKNK